MDKMKLRGRHTQTVLKAEAVFLLEYLRLKNFLRRKFESNEPAFKESLNIDMYAQSIFVLPNIPWSYRKQRPQQIFGRLAKKGFNIFYISPITSDTEYITRIDDHIYEVHLKTKTAGNVLRDFHLDEKNVKDFTESFKRLLGEYIKRSSLLFILHPVWKDVGMQLKGVKRIYDLMDLYSGFPEAKEELVRAEEELIRESDIVIATASNLYNYARKLNNHVYMVGNGADFEEFSSLKENRKLDGLKGKPIIGYFGAISDWIDFDLLEYAIEENDNKAFVFIGSIGTKKARRLYKYTNVYFLGEVEHRELPGYLAYFDICTIPFKLNDLVKSTNPVKFYEYIASGKPVVTVDLPELRQYSDICYLSKSKEEFSKNIFKALHEDDEETRKKRIRIARKNSWEEKVENLVRCCGL